MKTLKISLIALCLGWVVSGASAMEPSKRAYKRSVEYAVDSYINGVCKGQVESYLNLLDDDTKFTLLRGQRIMNYSKDQEVKVMRTGDPVVQNCEHHVDFTQKLDNYAVAKVTLQYPNFKRINFVTFQKEGNAWKITEVSSVFE